MSPPFRADHVGSLLRPPGLLDARAQYRAGTLTAAQLKELEDECILQVVRRQEELGLRAVTDGEFRRTLWHLDFLKQFANVEVTRSPVKVHFHTDEGEIERAPSALRVTGPLSRPHPIFVEHYRFVHAAARVRPKLTLPSPSILHFRGGRDAIDRQAYPDLTEFYSDLARVYSEEVADLGAAGCRYLQLDEVNFAYLCDPKLRREVQSYGEDPEQLPHTYARLINGAIGSRPRDMTVCMHLCRGNFEGAWLAEGGYEPVAEVLFNEIDVTGYFLEYDSARAGGFAPLRLLPKGKTVVLGLISSKRGALENKDEIRRRIDEAARYVPLEQLAVSPQCGFASGERGNKLTQEEQFAKLSLVVEVARDIWG
ncbi:MAG TPA: 5-methyltetrahydropteroyltriglutamate--homocysteine S-methyltransferase [Steroidobacteraceae bacterium]|jgi:5-methyltetrahydropteroyltriglutamate--homocysteine methyltransferase|nr:5-methyltetrahydropteroyltriglutamate--homocysteine S-methyltransferase [Steroidobacteraceae bacterium]